MFKPVRLASEPMKSLSQGPRLRKVPRFQIVPSRPGSSQRVVHVYHIGFILDVYFRIRRARPPFRIRVLEAFVNDVIDSRFSDVKVGDEASSRVGEIDPAVGVCVGNPPIRYAESEVQNMMSTLLSCRVRSVSRAYRL